MDKEMKERINELLVEIEKRFKQQFVSITSIKHCFNMWLPEAFVEEKRMPKLGEVWEINGFEILVTFGNVYINLKNYFWIEEGIIRINSSKFLAPSLEEYYRMKFEKEINYK